MRNPYWSSRLILLIPKEPKDLPAESEQHEQHNTNAESVTLLEEEKISTDEEGSSNNR